MSKPTQEQMFHQSHRQINDTLQQAYWMAGKMPDSQGRMNPNPLTDAEIRRLAASNRPYAHAFEAILAAGGTTEVNLTNLKATVSIKLELELEAWQNGERRWTVVNQFDQTVLKSALANIDNIEAAAEGLTPEQCNAMSTMTWAHRLADYTPPEMDRAWID